MSDSLFRGGGGCGLAPSKDTPKRKRPRVLLGGGPGFAVRIAESLRSQGWDVCTAATGDDLHTRAVRKDPAAVLLPVEAGGESGYLTCAKLRLARPKLRVLLVGEATTQAERLARFVGAGLTTEAAATDAVLKLI